MKIGAMLGDIFRSLFKKPATEMYPYVRTDAPDRFRGQLKYKSETWTGCQLCVKDCPADAIEIVTIDKVAKKFVMRYRADRCIFCAQCVQSCRFGCIELSSDEWELASDKRQPFELIYGRKEDIDALLERATQLEPAEAAK